MARKITPPPSSPVSAHLSPEHMQRGVTRLQRLITEIEGFDISGITTRSSSAKEAMEANIEGTLTSVFGHNTIEYERYRRATRLDRGEIVMSMGPLPAAQQAARAQKFLAEGKVAAIDILRSAIKWLEDEIANAAEPATVTGQPASSPAAPSNKIFIVHGHDESAKQLVARFVERLGFQAIILSEQANQGRTIIEKIEAHDDVGFAIVLLTGDDLGGKTLESLRPRARQNVLLELGYFMAKLTRARVCALAKGDLEIPTDFAGVVWEALDDAGAWKMAVARELEAAGYAIDWNAVMRHRTNV
ncbi:nucleotide-binding protein [Acidovorax sp. LjRoot118]|uniref:TIR domain-containing protein n=1 Tax=Acidovorax sp. LjRoot118 TaxID=3342256 RepID=UPI003ECE50F3